MTTSPEGFDCFLTDAAIADLDVIAPNGSIEIDALFAVLLADPTEANSAVRSLSRRGVDSVYRFSALGYSVFYQFESTMHIKVIAVVPFLFGND